MSPVKTSLQLVSAIYVFHRNWSCTTAFTTARHWSLFWQVNSSLSPLFFWAVAGQWATGDHRPHIQRRQATSHKKGDTFVTVKAWKLTILIQVTASQLISLRFTLILHSNLGLGFPVCLFPPRFLAKSLYALLQHACPSSLSSYTISRRT
jgi:hypothetical protein